MSHNRVFRRMFLKTLTCWTVLLVLAHPAARAEEVRKLVDSERLTLRNLVGEGGGAGFEVIARAAGRDAHSGDIALTLPSGASADVHAETRGGSISVEGVGGAEFRQRDPDEVRMILGDGSARVRLGTGGGDIRIRG